MKAAHRARVSSTWTMALAFTACAGGPTADATEPCTVGSARDASGACVPATTLQITLDERQDVRDDTTRRGIGAFACTLRPFAHEPVDEEGACVLYRFDGELIAEGFMGDAGGILVELDEPIAMFPSDTSCYDTDLFPTRSDLFSPHVPFFVRTSGGADFPAFDAVAVGPETLAIDDVGPVTRGEPLTLRWLPSSADALLLVVNSYDATLDESARIVCVFDDERGEGTVDGRLTASLIEGDDEAALTVLRQRVTHVEFEDPLVAIDVLATSSVIRAVPLLP